MKESKKEEERKKRLTQSLCLKNGQLLDYSRSEQEQERERESKSTSGIDNKKKL